MHTVDVYIVSAAFPALFVLDAINREILATCTVSNRLVKHVQHTSIVGEVTTQTVKILIDICRCEDFWNSSFLFCSSSASSLNPKHEIILPAERKIWFKLVADEALYWIPEFPHDILNRAFSTELPLQPISSSHWPLLQVFDRFLIGNSNFLFLIVIFRSTGIRNCLRRPQVASDCYNRLRKVSWLSRWELFSHLGALWPGLRQ